MKPRIATLMLGLSLLSAAPAAANSIVLVRGDSLNEPSIPHGVLLPDGQILDFGRLINACAGLQSMDLLRYDPATKACQRAGLVDRQLLAEPGPPDPWLIFNLASTESCLPNHCQVAVAGAGLNPDPPDPIDPLFQDRFESGFDP